MADVPITVMKRAVALVMILFSVSAYAADVKVEKVDDSTVKVVVTPARRFIRETVRINQVDVQMKQMQAELVQLDDAEFISVERQKAIANFDSQIEQRKALLNENIKVYTEIISQSDALGVKVTAVKKIDV